MIKGAIDKILNLADSKPVEVGGRQYWSKSGNPISPPTIAPVSEVDSLDALLSALDSPEIEATVSGSLEIVVRGPKDVSIVTGPSAAWLNRHKIIDAKCRTGSFPFDRYVDIEEFIVRAQCLFVDTDVKTTLIDFVSSIKSDETVTNADNGISQEVVTEDRISRRKGREKFSPILVLKPYRTFPEVEQPESRFLLRMKKGNDAPVKVAIFEADGGLWVSKACANVAKYIRENKLVKARGVSVIG
jgi:hypothetical protein